MARNLTKTKRPFAGKRPATTLKTSFPKEISVEVLVKIIDKLMTDAQRRSVLEWQDPELRDIVRRFWLHQAIKILAEADLW